MGAPITRADIREAVRRRGKVDPKDTFILDSIDDFVNQRYLSVSTEMKWRWLKLQREIKIHGKYETGTVTVANDDRAITGAATSWTEDMKGRFIKIAGENTIFEILDINESTQVMNLSERVQRASGSGLAYTMFQPEYGLFPDLDYIDEVWHDHTPRNVGVEPIDFNEYTRLISLNQMDEGKCDFYTREGFKDSEWVEIGQYIVGHDFIGCKSSYRISLFPPVADEDYILRISYVRKVDILESDGDEPLMPVNDRWVLVYGALADYYDMQGNETSMAFWNQEFDKGLKRMMKDNRDTDEKLKFVVGDRWRKDGRRVSPSRYDLGVFFDK